MALHDKHRERMRTKFAKNPSLLEDHEVLELLLFYAIPRRNTNEIAHNLLGRCGNIKNVMDSGIYALMDVEGIGENTALYLRVVTEAMVRYRRCEAKERERILHKNMELKKYLCNLFHGTQNEEAYLLLFDPGLKLKCCEKLSEGHSVATMISVRDIVAKSLNSSAASLILVHNHPGGRVSPSYADIEITCKLRNAFRDLEVEFIDHYIVAGNACEPIESKHEQELFSFRLD